ncbi:Vta1 like-domain-containing protein [Cerioporus squamosus]|nr:Vta1 like-domain-containing protein [Cerioporus squamosus]
MVLSLPPIPPELKAITPYLQRADELQKNDPVASYWCAYYAAQQGIALKVKESAARHFLFDLLGLLERMKTDIGPNDAVHDEPASAAYMENFALRVFAGADNEDRNGNVTRNTARKFLVAANFLEVLRTFDSDKAGLDLPAIEEKIKYAKWKAADISKAIREGRKPTPGAPGESPAPEAPAALPDLPDVVIAPPTTPPSTSSTLPDAPSPPSITRSTPPPPQLTGLTPTEHSGAHLPNGLAPPQPPQSPGSWSTAATPGTPGFHLEDSTPPAFSAGPVRRAFVSEELEGKTEDEIDGETTPPPSAAKPVHFSPSAVGGQPTPGAARPDEDPFSVRPPGPSAPPFNPQPYGSASAPPIPPAQTSPTRPPPPPAAAPSPSRSQPQGYVQGVPAGSTPQLGAATATVTMMPPQLTPQIISRAQKHCRFAISALDYEDGEQAVKELREALRLLGG